MLGGIMGMMGGGGGPMGMIQQLMQTVQQMQPQQSGGADQCSQGGGRMIPPRCSSRSCSSSRSRVNPLHPRDLTWRSHADGSACGRHSAFETNSGRR